MTRLADLLWAELCKTCGGADNGLDVTKEQLDAALTEAGRQFRAESDARGQTLTKKVTPPRNGY